MSALLVK